MNDPVNLQDPSGNIAISTLIMIGGLVAWGAGTIYSAVKQKQATGKVDWLYAVSYGASWGYTAMTLGLAVASVSSMAATVSPQSSGRGNSNGRNYWNTAVNHNGTKVYQRNDLIKPSIVDGRGRSNLERMEKGLAPIGPDGNSINLHHLTQTNSSPIAEVTQSFHQINSKVIHINPNTMPSGIDRGSFNSWKSSYWKMRVNDFR